MKVRQYKILVAESDNKWFDWISSALEKRDYSILRAEKSGEVFSILQDNKPDLLILEQQLEDMDGVEIITELRDNAVLKRLPIVVFTGNADKYTQLAAYSAGADLFITKGIRTKIFLASLNAILRRCYEMTEQNPIKQFGLLKIDEEQFAVYRNGIVIDISKKEFQILALLASRPGKVFKRPFILNRIWGDNIIVGDRNIDTHIKKLRKKLGKEYIKTTRGVGYKFMVPDTKEPAAS